MFKESLQGPSTPDTGLTPDQERIVDSAKELVAMLIEKGNEDISKTPRLKPYIKSFHASRILQNERDEWKNFSDFVELTGIEEYFPIGSKERRDLFDEFANN